MLILLIARKTDSSVDFLGKTFETSYIVLLAIQRWFRVLFTYSRRVSGFQMKMSYVIITKSGTSS